MDSEAIGSKLEKESSSYKVIAFIGPQLPAQFKSMIYAKWLRGLRQGNDYFKLIQSDIYYAVYQKYLDAILNRLSTVIRIAVLTDDIDVALGFSVSEGNTLHFVFVHADMRRQGIAKSLTPFDIEIITHITKMSLLLWSAKAPKAIFNPF